jgi:hypothetical protein
MFAVKRRGFSGWCSAVLSFPWWGKELSVARQLKVQTGESLSDSLSNLWHLRKLASLDAERGLEELKHYQICKPDNNHLYYIGLGCLPPFIVFHKKPGDDNFYLTRSFQPADDDAVVVTSWRPLVWIDAPILSGVQFGFVWILKRHSKLGLWYVSDEHLCYSPEDFREQCDEGLKLVVKSQKPPVSGRATPTQLLYTLYPSSWIKPGCFLIDENDLAELLETSWGVRWGYRPKLCQRLSNPYPCENRCQACNDQSCKQKSR